MSVVISSHDDVARDPGNSSPSKAQYSFSKEPRFVASYKYYDNNVNRNTCYFEGKDAARLSTLS